MANKERLLVSDPNKILAVVKSYPLATVITLLDGRLQISHLPIVATLEPDDRLKLEGHLSTKNPQWNDLKKGASMTLIFNGPNAYINSSWYFVNDVSTWNYVTVHAAGTPVLEESYEGIVGILKATTKLANELHKDQWEFYIPDDLQSEKDLTDAIGGFSVIPSSLNARFKLSQSKSPEDQRRIISELSKRTDENSKLVGQFMSKNIE